MFENLLNAISWNVNHQAFHLIHSIDESQDSSTVKSRAYYVVQCIDEMEMCGIENESLTKYLLDVFWHEYEGDPRLIVS